MRVEYDSDADALSIDLIDVDHWDGSDDPIDDNYCQVALAEGRLANIELFQPAGRLNLLDRVAERYRLDGQAFRAAARAALEAPDRVVTLQIAPRSGQ